MAPDYKIRPYLNSMEEHPQNLSSIILFTDNIENDIAEDTTRNFFVDFSDAIKNVDISSKEPVSTVLGNVYVSSLDNVNNYYGVFNNFSIMAVREAHDEIVKIHQNFGNTWNVFFFGERPAVYSFNGIFIDSADYPYYQEFMVAYDKLLAGRKCVENKTRMYLSCDNKIIEGYMLNISTTKTAESSLKKEFSFSLLVKNVYWVRNNIIIVSDGNGNVRYERKFNGLSNFGRLTLNETGIGINEAGL
jgi:hypothetical protein